MGCSVRSVGSVSGTGRRSGGREMEEGEQRKYLRTRSTVRARTHARLDRFRYASVACLMRPCVASSSSSSVRSVPPLRAGPWASSTGRGEGGGRAFRRVQGSTGDGSTGSDHESAPSSIELCFPGSQFPHHNRLLRQKDSTAHTATPSTGVYKRLHCSTRSCTQISPTCTAQDPT